MTRKFKRKFWNWFWRIMILVVAILLVSINGNQAKILIQQIDTLDQLNYVRQVLELQDENPDAISEAEPVDQISSIKLTPEEREKAFRVVMSESGDEDLQAQMAVAQTLYDRMNDFGNTLQEAIVNGVYSTKDNGEPTDSVKLAVANVFDGGMRVFEGGTYQVHDNTVDPYWTEGKIYRGSIGNLKFYGGYEE